MAATEATTRTRETPPKAERKKKVTLTLSPRLLSRLREARGGTPLSPYVEDACEFFLAFVEVGREILAQEAVAEGAEE